MNVSDGNNLTVDTRADRQWWERTRYPGVYRMHARGCKGGRCCCAYQARIRTRGRKQLTRSFPTLGEAKAWRSEMTTASEAGKLIAPSRTTVAEAAERLLAGMRDGSIPASSGRRYRPATIRGYAVGLNKRVLPALGHKRLSEVRRADVQELADRLTAEGLSASTVQNTLDPLRVIFRRAIRREEGVGVDPTKELELRRPDGKRDRIAAPAEAAAMIAALPEGERALWATAFYAGLRRGELMALRWSDVDLPARVIHVKRGWDMLEGEQDGKSAAANRRVPILDPLATQLERHHKRSGRVGDALVFGATPTKPFTPESVRRRSLAAWEAENKRRLKAADDREGVELIEPMTLHEARHTCASVMIAAGVNAKALSVIMGHATIAMTFDTYGHLMPAGLDEAAAAANAYLAGARLRVVK